jgi:hypothetical protein
MRGSRSRGVSGGEGLRGNGASRSWVSRGRADWCRQTLLLYSKPLLYSGPGSVWCEAPWSASFTGKWVGCCVCARLAAP